MAANQTANFVVKAKDSASGPLGKIGASMGKLRRTGLTAFRAIGAASLAAGAALAGVAISAIKAAADDERQTILLTAALRQRGVATEGLNKKIDEQIISMGALGIADEQVRAGLEVGSRFFKDQATLLKANAVAADIAAVTGGDLAEVMMTIGKGAQGQTRGLKALGIELKKGATIQDILTAATQKYGGIAAEIANSTSGQFAAAQVEFNEALEKFGFELLPAATEAMKVLRDDGLPAMQGFLDGIVPIFEKINKESLQPFMTELGKLNNMLGTDVGIFAKAAELALTPLSIIINTMTAGLQALNAVGDFFNIGEKEKASAASRALGGGVGTSFGAPGAVTLVTNVSIGTAKVDTVVTDSIKRTATPGRMR